MRDEERNQDRPLGRIVLLGLAGFVAAWLYDPSSAENWTDCADAETSLCSCDTIVGAYLNGCEEEDGIFAAW